ncbi:putative secreted effector protein, partial [Blumeria graminis f. sp. tritici 96224]
IFEMRSANLASLSLFFGFLILESAADYVCSGGTRIPDNDVEARANQIYSRGVSLNASRTPGQDRVEDIEFDGDADSGDLAFTGDFYPQITSSGTYKITVDYPSKKILLLETTVFVGGNIVVNCKKH